MRPALLLVGLVLAGCGTQVSPEPAPTPTLTPTYNEDAIALLMPFAHNRAEVTKFVDTVCGAPETPQQLIDNAHADAVLVRLAVVAGCPDRKDWLP